MAKEWHAAQLESGSNGYSDWNFGEGRTYYPIAGVPVSPGKFHILLQFDEGAIPKKTSESNTSSPISISSFGQLPISLFFQPFAASVFEKLDTPSYVPALADENDLLQLASDELLRKIFPQVIVGRPHGRPPNFDDPLCNTTNHQPAPLEQREAVPDMVVMGIIDDGIAFAHERFRTKDNKTRIEYAWIQDGECCHDIGACGPGESPVSYGREFRKFGSAVSGGIDELLEECTSGGFLDEEEFYARIGLTDHARSGHKAVALRSAHGTKVMDLASGYDPETEDRQGRQRPIVSVQLHSLSSADTSGASLEPNVLEAIWYILDRADRIAKSHGLDHLPVVINFSYGMISGPHDGTSPLEAAIDEIIERRRAYTGLPFDIVLPSGNSHLSRCHAQVSFPKKDVSSALNWHILPDDRTSSFMEIWLPYSASTPTESRLKISIKPPWGEASECLEEVNFKTGRTNSRYGYIWLPTGRKKPNGDEIPALCKVTYEYVGAPTNRGRFFIAVPPTAFHDTTNDLAPPGIWTITLTNQALGPHEKVEAWIQRGDTPYTFYPRGRQSFFEESSYVRYDPLSGRLIEDDDHPAQIEMGPCPVKRAGHISPIATGNRTVVTGGTLGKEMKATRYSAGGPITPTRDAGQVHREGPDAATVSDDSKVHRGVLAAGTRSGSVVKFTGTSAAAPQIARLLASEIAKYASDYSKYPGGREIVQREASTLPDAKPERVGHGLISKDKIPDRGTHPPRYWD